MSGDQPGSLTPEQYVDAFAETLLGVARATFDKRAPRSLTGDPYDALAFLVNATADEVERLVRDLQDTRDALVQAEKLSALGRVAAGMAHDMNQPLTVILALLETVQEAPETLVEDHLADLALIQEAAQHIAETIDQIRTFARPAPFAVSAIPPLSPLESAARLALSTHPDVPIEISADLPLPNLRGNRERLRHVFLNLLINAKQAVRSAGHGRILVSVLRDGDTLIYQIDDNGPGVPDHARHKVFEPFFTTKEVGEGSGLGLSVAMGIVVEHQGKLSHEPSPFGGARFVVRLPIAEDTP